MLAAGEAEARSGPTELCAATATATATWLLAVTATATPACSYSCFVLALVLSKF